MEQAKIFYAEWHIYWAFSQRKQAAGWLVFQSDNMITRKEIVSVTCSWGLYRCNVE